MCSIMGYIGSRIPEEEFKLGFDMTVSRGPDMSRIEKLNNGFLGFHRLAIMGLTDKGMQPFSYKNNKLVCNGEIYGFRPIKDDLIKRGYTFEGNSDCEILLPLYELYGTDMFKMLDAEFALIIYDGEKDELIAARDPIGIRPLYYGLDKDKKPIFASEPKNLVGLVDKIMPFPPGHYYKDGKFICYNDIAAVDTVCHDDLETVCENIHNKLVQGIEKRLDADAPLGFLLSGGLDSSLVCAVSAKLLKKPIKTFAIGMSTDAIDLKYAKEVADYIGSDHREIIITKEDVLKALPDVIAILGTYDITTIRASIGMYLICKAIHETTDIRVLLTGEISDELFGYKYTDFAPFTKWYQKGDTSLTYYNYRDSFPSGHTVYSCTIFLSTLFCGAFKRLKKFAPIALIVSFVYVFLMGWSRLVAGAHYLTDVAAGAIIGYSIILVGWALYNRFNDKGILPTRK